ncbi:hypothetical protein F4861DRAFT_518185 [Xylaria intraflava]|nr:hypothetical protein F4861DRAFT_518185 [Xylaria intraflava]
MADNPPKVWAAADLDPVSPAPVHPPSPILIPGLQNQADVYRAVSLNDNQPAQTAQAAAAMAQAPDVDAQTDVTAVTISGDTPNIAYSTKHSDEANKGVDTVSVSTRANDTQVTAVFPSDTPCAADQPVPKLGKSVMNSDVSSSAGTAVTVADNSPAIPSHSPISIPPAGSKEQPPPKLPGVHQVVSEAAVSNLPKIPPPTAVVNAAHSSASRSIHDNVVPHLPLKPPANRPPPHIPQAAQSGGMPLPSNKGAYVSTSHAGPVPGPTSARRGTLPKQDWDAFLREEQKYIFEAKWDKFPEGSRIFIGNLASDQTSKREVFDLFSKFGRLAQISLKSTFGFVQCHTTAESQAAITALQGTEIKGKQIHLEVTHRKKKQEITRASRKRNGDQDGKRGRDDHRAGRQFDPQHKTRRRSSYNANSQDRGGPAVNHSDDRRRSRSPKLSNQSSYRRRSRSSHRQRSTAAVLDSPGRHGADIPDIRCLILGNIKPNFISWVKNAFIRQGLSVDFIPFNAQLSRDAFIQRQVVEGVHAVADLDFRCQQIGKIQLQVFDRSAVYPGIRFDQYQDLDPAVAGQLVIRAKAQAESPTPLYGGNNDGQYNAAQQHPVPQPGRYNPPSYIQPHPHEPYASALASGAGGSHLDTARMPRTLGSSNGQVGMPRAYGPNDGKPNAYSTRLSGNLGNMAYEVGPPSQPHPTRQGMGRTYAGPNTSAGGADDDNAAHIQRILTELTKYK